MSPATVPQRLALAGLLIASPLFAGFGEDIGFSELQAEFGSSLPDGSTLKIAQIEYVRAGTWAPEAVGELAGKVFIYSPSKPASFSYDGNEVGRVFYGSLSSIIPAAADIHAFEAWDYFDNSLKTAKGAAPLIADWDVENHSYISDSSLNNDEGNRRLDYRVDHDGVTATVALENGPSTIPPLFGNTYNAIVVGSSTGDHSRGGTTRDLAGRMKPDIVGTATYTSFASPIVGSAAGLLIAKAMADSSLSSAKRPEVIKAMLMAGATKDEFPSWSRTATAPLDLVYGAGEVNINNSYRILIAGRQPASPSTIRSNRGWDLNSAETGSSQRYFFTIGSGQSGTVSAVLTWNRAVTPNNGGWKQGVNATVDNYDLRLYQANAQFEKGDLLQDSLSTIDNVEHVFLNNAGEGTYVLEVTSVSGSKQFGLAWTVFGVDSTPPPPAPEPAVIVTQPIAQTVTAGSPATFSVEVSGTPPFTYQWRKDGVAISGASSSSYSISSTALSDAGTYSVSIENSGGGASSTGAYLTVNSATLAPSITSQPVAATANVGGNATFSISVSGTSPFTYQWRKDGVAISGATGSSLSLDPVSSTDAGTYSVVVSNAAGSATSSGAYLTVSALVNAPSITSQPVNLTVTVGENATFSVSASGTAPFTYQWRKDGVAISGATGSSLSLDPVSSTDAGTYSVVVSNAAGSADSNGAYLAVNAAPTAPKSTVEPTANLDGKLVNISSRSNVGTGFDILISGFVVTGTAPKQLLIRAVGPSLSQFGLSRLLQRPKIRVYSGDTLIFETAAGSRIPSVDVARSASQLGGAFALPDSSSDTVVVRSFDPGAYTVQVSGENEGKGIAIVEVYDLDSSNPASRLVNLSTRSMVGRGTEILIPGLYVAGSSPRRVLLRAVGPGLKQWGVENTLARPKIALYRGTTKIAENVGWGSSYNEGTIAAVSSRVGAFPLSPGSADSALLVTLAPGAYTMHVSGADGDTGVVLAELYDSGPAMSSDASQSSEAKTRKIYGHYMGCFVAGSGAIQYHATTGIAVMDPPAAVLAEQQNPLRPLLGDWAQTSVGGTYRNFALAPQDRTLSMRESARLEIYRAMRIGLDGFTFDAWAGGKGARDLLDVMFDICETENLPFELTITLDTSCLNSTDPDLAVYTGNVWEKTIKWLLDKHGDSPNLARRDGKVLIMGYQSIWPGQYAISQHVKRTMPLASASEQTAEANRLRTSEQGWQMIADTYRKMETNVGQPIYWEFCLNAFFLGVPSVPPNGLKDAAAYLAQYFPALGMFEWTGDVPAIAAGVLSMGAEWSHPMKMQYENFGYYQSASPGINWVRGDWKHARTLPSTLIQHITWNDYHEATNLSPGYNTRYAYYDYTGELIRWWKTGKEPASDRDKVYLFSHKYAHDTPMFPFKAKTRADNVIEVVTILREPATLRIPGRMTVNGETEWQAPAGMSSKQFPLTPGEVSVELVRNGAVVIRLDSPEPVSDRPFRQDTGKVAISTEDHRLWAEDFGADEPFFNYSEYGDEDGDGLPNWFEMLWYGKFGMMNTATAADPHADPAGTGKTNLQHYLDQTNPFKK